jgi:hypothetical protein
VRIHTGIEQGTPEWFALRINKATASEFDSVLAKGQGKMRATYLRRVVAEALTGKPIESRAYGSWAANLERGHEQEPLAGMAYELKTDNIIQRVSFIEHDTLRAGCSPDALILGKRRGAEIKCVIPTVQIETVLGGTYPSEHRAQIQGSMWITGYEEWDFCSYSPDMPAHLRTYVYTVKRDEAYIAMLENEVLAFLKDVDSALARLNAVGVPTETLLRKSLETA